MLILTAGRFGQGLLLLSVIILPIWAVSLSTLGRSTGLPTTRDGSDYWILRYVDDQIETAIQQKLPPKERFQKWEEQLSDVELESFWRNRLSADDYLLPIDFLSIDPFKLELDPSDEGHPKLRFSSDLVLFSLFFLGPEKLGVFSSNLFPDSDITWTSGSKIIEDWGVFSDKALSSCHILSNYVLLTETSITESVWLHENCPVGPEKINLIANFAFLLTDYANANFEKPTHVKNNNLPSDTDVAPAVRSLSEILTSGTIPNTVTAVASKWVATNIPRDQSESGVQASAGFPENVAQWLDLMDARPETAPSKPDYASLIMFSPRVYGLSQLIAKSIANELMIFFKAELSRRKMQPWTMDMSVRYLDRVTRWHKAVTLLDFSEKGGVSKIIADLKNHQFPQLHPTSEEEERQNPSPKILAALHGIPVSRDDISPPAELTRMTAVLNALGKPGPWKTKTEAGTHIFGRNNLIEVARDAVHDYIRHPA